MQHGELELQAGARIDEGLRVARSMQRLVQCLEHALQLQHKRRVGDIFLARHEISRLCAGGAISGCVALVVVSGRAGVRQRTASSSDCFAWCRVTSSTSIRRRVGCTCQLVGQFIDVVRELRGS